MNTNGEVKKNPPPPIHARIAFMRSRMTALLAKVKQDDEATRTALEALQEYESQVRDDCVREIPQPLIEYEGDPETLVEVALRAAQIPAATIEKFKRDTRPPSIIAAIRTNNTQQAIETITSEMLAGRLDSAYARSLLYGIQVSIAAKRQAEDAETQRERRTRLAKQSRRKAGSK